MEEAGGAALTLTNGRPVVDNDDALGGLVAPAADRVNMAK